MTARIFRDGDWKHLRSHDENYSFNMKDGTMITWGRTKDEDVKYGKYGPYILDIEVSEICEGIPDVGSSQAKPCTWCYKSNTKAGRNMSFETFKDIFDKLPPTLTQIAFGIGNIWSNPDLRKMFEYCRNNVHNPGVVPNLTINGWGLDDEWADYLAATLGGVAVSRYENKDICYDAVKKMTDRGMAQVNIHMVVANENIAECYSLIDDVVSDARLAKLKAIVFLTLKPKGKRNKWTTIKDVNVYKELVTYAMDRGIGIGFDSCSAPTFLASMKDHPKFDLLSQLSESCESDRFSGYVNVEGIWSHCSFTEGLSNWGTVDLTKIEDFNRDVWNAPEVKKFRECLTCQDNKHIADEVYLCPVFKLYDDAVGNCATAIESDRGKKIISIVERVF